MNRYIITFFITLFFYAMPLGNAGDCDLVDEIAIKIIQKTDPAYSELFESNRGMELYENFKQVLHNSRGDLFAATQATTQKLGLGHYARVIYEKAFLKSKSWFGRRVVSAVHAFRHLMDHIGKIVRKYVSKQTPGAYDNWWQAMEELHQNGSLSVAFGYPHSKGDVRVMAGIFYSEKSALHLAGQVKHVGQDLVLGNTVLPVQRLKQSPMINVSGMSFPQISAQGVLALLYMHLKLAEKGVYTTINTGAGGPKFHLYLLHGKKRALKRDVIKWARDNKLLKKRSDKAKVVAFVDHLFKVRKKLWKTVNPNTTAQVVAQFHSALNGARTKEGRLDFKKLMKIGRDPHVGMIQFLLKQAAKRGAKLKSAKVDLVTAAMREIVPDYSDPNSYIEAPSSIPDVDSPVNVAVAIKVTKALTGKPVSLKFGVGDPQQTREFLAFLKKANALADHIQVDGAGQHYSPGSGAAAYGTDTSLPVREATIVMNRILLDLGIRDRIHVESSGEVFLPNHGVELLALGADSVAGARTYMAMGLGCSRVKKCASGNCPYGIAARSAGIFALGMNVEQVASRALSASASWHKNFVLSLAELGIQDWRHTRQSSRALTGVTRFNGEAWIPLAEYYARYLKP